jgi:predicted N-acyltransferase
MRATLKALTNQSSTGETTRFAYFPSVEAAGSDWAALAHQSGDVFFQAPFLQTVETNPPVGMRLGYLLAYQHGQPVGIAVCQVKHFSANESIVEENASKNGPCVFTGISNWFKKRVSGWVEADIIICGNLLVTGAHGYWFDPTRVDTAHFAEMLTEGLQYAARQVELTGTKISMILVKDVPTHDQDSIGEQLLENQYTEFEIQPNMVLHLPFDGFDQYLAAMSTKYRTRAKRAFKKLEGIERRELTALEVQQSSTTLFKLYKEVATNAGFNMVDLNPNYMAALHQHMQGRFRVFGYFLDGEMVCYCTTLLNGPEMEAHFLGYSKAHNAEYQLYLNMLYDMVRTAFESGCQRVVFARTALEIKSSIGAEPEQLLCYLCHQNGLLNKFTGTILEYLKPTEEWEQRHPFKD